MEETNRLPDDVLESIGIDEIRSRLYDSAGNPINPATDALEEALKSNDTDEVVVRITGSDGEEVVEQALNTDAAATDAGLLTFAARALQTVAEDELRARVFDTNGNGVDPATAALENALESNGTDKFGVNLYGQDDTGNAAEVQAEELDTDLAGTETALVTAIAAALASVGDDELRVEQQSPVGVEDSTGTQVDPALATDYLGSQTIGHDLVGSGDLAIGPGAVERGTAVIIAATSTDNNAFSVSVSWEDDSGNVFQTEDATDIGLDTITEDYARLVRKAPQVSITVTDESGAAQNNINVHADTER